MIITRDVDVSYEKTLIRAISFFLTLSLLTGLLIPFASAIEYEGVESMTVDATAALLIDLDTDQVLYEQAADEQRYPASITKIMTALLTLEAIGRGELDLNTEITVDAAALADITEDSSTANLQAGEKITVKNLLYCLLLASANEAANVLAMAVSGDIPTFVELMNQRAQELGMAGTHFVNPHGLHNADHYSTARDIYRMSKQAMTHATFREIVSTGRYTVPATNLSQPRKLLNTNGLLTSAKHYGYTMDGTIGIKTGSTGEAGYCLVAAVQKKGHTLVSVVLGAQNPTDSRGNVQRKQFTESKRLLNWGFTNFSDATLLDAETYLQELPVRFSSEASHVVVRPTRSVQVMVPGTYDPERLELRLRFHRDVASAPIEAGDVLGTVTVIYAGEEYATVDMAAVSDVSFSPFMAFVSSVNTVLGNIYVRLLLLIALALVVVGLVRRFQERTKEERRAKRQLRQQEKIAFRQREAEARQQDEAQAKLEKRGPGAAAQGRAAPPPAGGPGATGQAGPGSPGTAGQAGAGATGAGGAKPPAPGRAGSPAGRGTPAPASRTGGAPAPGRGPPPTGRGSPPPAGGARAPAAPGTGSQTPGRTGPPQAGGTAGPAAGGTAPAGTGRPGTPPAGRMGTPGPAG